MSAPPTPWMRRLPHAPEAPSSPTRLTRLVSAPEDAAPLPPARRPGPALLLVPPPGVEGTVTLDPEEPVRRLDAMQSGIGGLLVRGADRVAWEDAAERSGVVEAAGGATGDEVPLLGNRSLLRPQGGDVLVTLRHVRALRRLLIDAPAQTVVTCSAFGRAVVRAAEPTARLRLSVIVVDGRLEIRAEYGLPAEWRDALAAMGWSPLAVIPRPAEAWQ